MTDLPILDRTAIQRLQRLGGDDLVRRMIEVYLQTAGERVTAVVKGTASVNAREVEHAAHALKSSAANVGAARLQRVAESIETLARAGAIQSDHAERLIVAWRESERALRELLEEHDA